MKEKDSKFKKLIGYIIPPLFFNELKNIAKSCDEQNKDSLYNKESAKILLKQYGLQQDVFSETFTSGESLTGLQSLILKIYNTFNKNEDGKNLKQEQDLKKEFTDGIVIANENDAKFTSMLCSEVQNWYNKLQSHAQKQEWIASQEKREKAIKQEMDDLEQNIKSLSQSNERNVFQQIKHIKQKLYDACNEYELEINYDKESIEKFLKEKNATLNNENNIQILAQYFNAIFLQYKEACEKQIKEIENEEYKKTGEISELFTVSNGLIIIKLSETNSIQMLLEKASQEILKSHNKKVAEHSRHLIIITLQNAVMSFTNGEDDVGKLNIIKNLYQAFGKIELNNSENAKVLNKQNHLSDKLDQILSLLEKLDTAVKTGVNIDGIDNINTIWRFKSKNEKEAVQQTSDNNFNDTSDDEQFPGMKQAIENSIAEQNQATQQQPQVQQPQVQQPQVQQPQVQQQKPQNHKTNSNFNCTILLAFLGLISGFLLNQYLSNSKPLSTSSIATTVTTGAVGAILGIILDYKTKTL